VAGILSLVSPQGCRWRRQANHLQGEARLPADRGAKRSGLGQVVESSPLRHPEARRHGLHYDLRLELDGVFKSWAVTKGPSLDPHDKRLAVEVEDHPLDYGDFEGTIPKGRYGGGTVMLWDRGYWEPEGTKGPEQALAKGDFKFNLEGERLHGGFVLVRMAHDRERNKRTNWLLIINRMCWLSGQGVSQLAARCCLGALRASGRVLVRLS
jgi:DNA ligase D-like protein (predicted 3'-phosphoesterase)